MLINKKIEALSEQEAKRLLHKAAEKLAERMTCEACVMKIVCGQDLTDEDCMNRVLSMLFVSAGMKIDLFTAAMRMELEKSEPGDLLEQGDDGNVSYATIPYDPETMQVI